MEDIKKHINNGLETLSKIKETHTLGAEPQMVKIAKTSKYYYQKCLIKIGSIQELLEFIVNF